MDGWLLSAEKLPHCLQLPLPPGLLEPVVAGLLIAWLAVVLRPRKGAVVHKASGGGGAASPGLGGSPEESPRAFSDDVEIDTRRPPRQPHIQGTFVPSTGLLHSNAYKPYPFENENCSGQFIPLHRPTYDAALDKSGEYPYGDHFQGRKRLWELRVQLKFKNPVVGPLLVGIELENYVPLNAASKRLMGLTVAALRQVAGSDLYHSVGDDPRQGCAPHEKPVFILPLWVCDQLVVTPEGEAPPDLTDAHFSAYGTKRVDDRRAFVQEVSELQLTAGPTYTFVFWGISQFLDCIQWEVQKIIPFKSIDFDQFCGRPPVNLVFYTLGPEVDGDRRHLQSRKNYYFRFALWSSKRQPSPQKVRELIPNDGDLGAGRAHAGAVAADRNLLGRLFGCCTGHRPA